MNALQKLGEYRCPRYSEYPVIPLYKDQVITFLTQAVAPFYNTEQTPVTSAMINNYVKLKVISPPERKKYTRHQLICLYVIFLLKQILSIDEIRQLLQWEFSPESLESSYACFCTCLEHELSSLPAGCECTSAATDHPLLEMAIRSFVYKRYTVVLLSQTPEPSKTDE